MPVAPAALSRALLALEDVRWSVKVCDGGPGDQLFGCTPDTVLPTASVGKVLLLVETARQLESGELEGSMPLLRTAEDGVQDSGIWQFMAADRLGVEDLALLVGALSDNLATNVLLRRVGLEQVRRTAERLGLRATRLHDQVRDRRGPSDPATLSEGSAAEWVDLLARLSAGAVVSAEVCHRVLTWLQSGADLSMVA